MAFLTDIHTPKVYFRKLTAITKDFIGGEMPLPESSPSRAILQRKKEEFIALTIFVLRLRSAFHRLLNLWLVRRIDRKTPAICDDPITLEPIRKSVKLYDMRIRWCYQFEARPLLQSIRSQLSEVYYGYPQPTPPRNPYTNTPFTPSQLTSLHAQTLAHGITCWEFEAYMAAGMDIDKFARNHIIVLHNSIRFRELSAPDPPEGAELVHAFFIEMCDQLGVAFSRSHSAAFMGALINPTWFNHPYILAWRRIYMTTVLYCNEIAINGDILQHANYEQFNRVQIDAGNLIVCFAAFYREYMERLITG